MDVISTCFTHHSSRVRGHELCDDALERVLELRLHFVMQTHEQHPQSHEAHAWSLVSRIATGKLYRHDVGSHDFLICPLIHSAKPPCGSLIGRGVDSGMLDEINHREYEISRSTRRAAHLQVGHALDQVGHVCLCCPSLPCLVCFDLTSEGGEIRFFYFLV